MRKKPVSRSRKTNSPPYEATVSSIAQAPAAAALLAAFRALAANDVYTMAPKTSVVRGYDYYRQQRLQHYVWNKDGATLTAQVQGTILYEVVFSLDDGYLSAFCDCPAWEFECPCKHVLCACFTTKHLLVPETFQLSDREQAHLATLRTELLGEPGQGTVPLRKGDCPPESGYEIVIDANLPYPQLSICCNGVRLPAGWAPALPPELRPLLHPSWFSSTYGDDPLLRYLGLVKRQFPLVLKVGRDSLVLQWAPMVVCQSKTEIALSGDAVRIRAVCLADGAVLDRIVRFRSFVVDVSGRRLLLLEDEGGWASFQTLRHGFQRFDFSSDRSGPEEAFCAVTLPDSESHRRWQGLHHALEFTVSREEFQSAQIDLIRKQADNTLRDLLLSVDGHEMPVRSSAGGSGGEERAYTVTLRPLPDESGVSTTAWMLQAQCRHGEAWGSPSASTFSFIHALEQGRAVSGPLRTQKRKAVLYELFF
ncbi:MAG: hypothetical protein U0936_28655, partial [Planctomycetaceae bacterium]